MINATQRRSHERWLKELTAIPTAAGHEDRVIRWIEAWVKSRRNLRLRRDGSGNLLVTRTTRPRGGPAPIYLQAHLDHPAFVVRRVLDARTLEMEFRGGVHDPYFTDARIEIIGADDHRHPARVTALEPKAKPFKRVTARLTRAAPAARAPLAAGDIGRWHFSPASLGVRSGILHAHACDDLAGVAAALGALDVLRTKAGTGHVGILFTRAEEVGFIGTLAACRDRSVPKSARLICLENSRSFPESPIGGGPILRVGDRMSVFDPVLTNRIGALCDAHAAKRPAFRWQRKLMPGGACEATAYSTFGWSSTCLCLPLGNYHNMTKIDAVLGGHRPARTGPEHIAVADFHGLVEMLVIAATGMDSGRVPPLEKRLSKLLAEREHVLG